MRAFRSILLLFLVSLSTPAPVSAETTIYFLGHAVEVPAPIMLIVLGLALLAIGVGLKNLLRFIRDQRDI
jgi:hypothetical protein